MNSKTLPAARPLGSRSTTSARALLRRHVFGAASLLVALWPPDVASASDAPLPPPRSAPLRATATAPRPRAPQAPAATAAGDFRLAVADIARMTVKNSPALRALALDPAIAGTRTAEALSVFDPRWETRLSVARNRAEVFTSPFGATPGASGSRFATEDRIGGSTTLSRLLRSGGRLRFGYDATSTDRSGATSFSSLTPRYDGGVVVGYTHPLLRGAGHEVQLSPARESEILAEEARQRVRRFAEQLVGAAEQVYWDLAGAIAEREVRRKSVDVAQSLVEVTQVRLDAGTAIPADVAQARAGLELRRIDLIAADARVTNLSDVLRETVLPFGADEGAFDVRIVPTDVPGRSAPPPAPTPAELRALAERRADVGAAAERVAAAEEALVRAEDDIQVELNAVANAGLRGLGSGFSGSSTQIGERDVYSWELGLELNVPLGNVAAKARLRRARLTVAQRRHDLAAVRNVAISELLRAQTDLRSARERVSAATAAVAAARLQLEAEQERLRAGTSTPFAVLDVEEDVVSAEAAEIRARVDVERARVAHDVAAGTVAQRIDSETLFGRDVSAPLPPRDAAQPSTGEVR